MFRLPLRRLATPRLAVPARTLLSARAYATPSQPPRPSQNTPTPAGLETVFGGKATPRARRADKPAAVEAEAKQEKAKETKEKENEKEEDSEEGGSWAERRPRLSDEIQSHSGSKKSGAGGGGGAGAGGSGGGAGGGNGWQGLTPNQLLLALMS
jgi:AFG3 family protein